jgi:hypothetical protein
MVTKISQRWLTMLTAASLLVPGLPSALAAPPAPTPVQQAPGADAFSVEQLDALLAPVALYPDQLLTQLLIAATFPLQIVEASRWLDDPAHKDLKGEALTKALEPLSWDPSVKSLVPFPQVLSQLNNNLEWTQQLGYAFANQQKETLDSVQRLRRQAQGQGHLQSTPQLAVRSEPPPSGATQQTIVIEPADPAVVYVPSYNPAVVYGAWPYPSYPPVVAAPAPGYVVGTALASGLAFGAGVAITSSLWGWSSPNWNHGDVNINANRWNNINVNRQRAVSNTWSPTLNRAGGRPPALQHPPAGPVGRPVHNAGLPANAIGRQSVRVPANLVNRPAHPNAGAVHPAANRPNLAPGSRPRPAGNHPAVAGQGQRPHPEFNRGSGGFTPHQGGAGHFQPPAGGFQRPAPGAFAGMNEGNRAAAFGQRGAQSRQFGGAQGGGGFHPRGGGGGFHPGGGGGGFHGGFHGRR